MSWELAWQSEVFRAYLFVVGGLVLLAGLVLTLIRFVLKKNINSIWTTYRGWLVMTPLVLGAIFAGREVTIIGFALIALLAFREFARATGLYRDWWMTGAVYLSILALGVVALIWRPGGPTSVWNAPGWYGLFMTLPVYAIALFLLIPILRNKTEGQLQRVSLAIVGFVYIGWMFGHLAFLANSNFPYGFLLYLIFAVEINDIAAFTFGKLFGKRKLRGQISPSKTWEGSLGALAVSMALPWLLSFSFPATFGATELILTGLIVGIGGQLGDLSISMIKRDLGIKDMGVMIPGHGGVLDRIDSLIYVAPLFFHMANFLVGLT
jgi:phosphatidate cytidylyltransferase